MRALLNPWRWPAAIGAACLLLLLLAGGAARLFPRGELGDPDDGPPGAAALLVMPVVTVTQEEPEPLPSDEDDERPRPREQPGLDLFRSLWTGWVAVQADGVTAAPETAAAPLALPSLDWSAAVFAPPDTSSQAILARALRLQNASWERVKPWALMGVHQRRAAHYQAMKKSVFNQNWLEDEDLR